MKNLIDIVIYIYGSYLLGFGIGNVVMMWFL